MRRGLFAAVCSLLLILPLAAAAAYERPIQVVVDGMALSMDVQPVMIDGRVMVPARFVAEALGAGVEWDQENQRVVITSKESKATTEAQSRIAVDDWISLRDAAKEHGLIVTVPNPADGVVQIEARGHFVSFATREKTEFSGVSDAGVTIRARSENGVTMVNLADLRAAGLVPDK